MGQRHSQNTAEDADTATVKQDYYELLGIERTASEDEVKKAYRRKALELHPDRNHGNEEWATKLFAEVQAAHEILSDPQERAWYDSHRDVLLRGGDPEQGEEYSYNIRMTSADEVLGLMMNFRNAPMTDSPTGFYGGLNDFFTQLAKEEHIACQWQDLDSLDYPEFGLKDDDYADTVRPFYGAWASFATKKSYAWKEKYRLSDAPDRYIRRLMDKENQKVREETKQEFNDAVRSLVAFVRKRDPRVKDSKQSEAERQKVLQEAAAAQRARAQAQRQAAMERHAENGVSSWIHQAAKDEHEGGFSSESEVEEHEYDCVVCDKTFKSEKQFHAHEKSKKHLKLLKELKWEMRKEGKELELEGENDVSESASEQEKGDKRAELFLEKEEEEEPKFTTAKHENPPDNNGKSEQHGSGTESEDTDDDDYAPRTEVVDRLDDKAVKDMREITSHLSLEDNDTPIVSGAETPSSKKLGKAKQKRAKKAAQQEEADSEAPDGFSCVICSAQFPSKTKLFDHIKVKGHAAPLNEVRTDRKGAKSNNKKKKK